MKNGLVTAGYRPTLPAPILGWNPFHWFPRPILEASKQHWGQHLSRSMWVCYHLSSPFIHHHLHCSTSLFTQVLYPSFSFSTHLFRFRPFSLLILLIPSFPLFPVRSCWMPLFELAIAIDQIVYRGFRRREHWYFRKQDSETEETEDSCSLTDLVEADEQVNQEKLWVSLA